MWISVLEDEAVLNNLITKYLQKEGYSVRSYLRGEDAVQGLDKPTDLWVIDIMLPDIDGFTVFREVQRKNPNSYVLLSRSEPQLLLLLLRERFQYRERRDHHPALLPRAARLSRRRHGCQHPLARVCLLPRVPLGYCGRGGRGLLLRLRLLPRLTAPAAPAGAAT